MVFVLRDVFDLAKLKIRGLCRLPARPRVQALRNSRSTRRLRIWTCHRSRNSAIDVRTCRTARGCHGAEDTWRDRNSRRREQRLRPRRIRSEDAPRLHRAYRARLHRGDRPRRAEAYRDTAGISRSSRRGRRRRRYPDDQSRCGNHHLAGRRDLSDSRPSSPPDRGPTAPSSSNGKTSASPRASATPIRARSCSSST